MGAQIKNKIFLRYWLVSILSLFLCAGQLHSQIFRLLSPLLGDSTVEYSGLASNGITAIVPQGQNILWFATGRGLSKTEDFGETFKSYLPGTGGLPRGGISAVATKDSVIWIAAVFDSSVFQEELQTGGGLAYSKDYGKTWHFVLQPVDEKTDTVENWYGNRVRFLPITTPINNTTWDISITEKWVYIVSWAGGLRRTADWGGTWERIPLPSDDEETLDCGPVDYVIDPRDPPFGNHNHKGFSILTYGDTIWVGTAGGINLGIIDENGCISWRRFTAQNSGISGNWVVALERQFYNGKTTIWAATLRAEDPGEYNALSKTEDGGITWTTTLEGLWTYNIASCDSVIYACTEDGLYKSLDGENWAKYNPIIDTKKNEAIFSRKVYSAFVDRREDPHALWVGTGDGLAKTYDDGASWNVIRAFQSAKENGEIRIYAYPNPFAPNFHNRIGGEGHMRIQYFLEEPSSVQLEIFNFAMELVYRGKSHFISTPGDHSEPWNGKDNNGNPVANGVYFCRLNIKTGNQNNYYWTKVIVIK